MISNSDLFYSRAKEFQNKRKDIVDTYEKRAAQLEDARGSKYFDDEMKKATDTRDSALSALKGEYAEYFRISLDAMAKANGSRGMTPPTDEELRLVQLLKMKDSVTEQELDAAANTLKGNTTCLAILTEIAHKQGFLRGYMSYSDSKEMPTETAADTVKGLHSSIREFMEYDTKRAARIAQEHNARMYGTTGNEPALPKRDLFDTKAGCYAELAGLSGDALTAFCKAVDGE